MLRPKDWEATMIRMLGVACIAFLAGSEAQASIISFDGTIAPEGDADVSFKGSVNDTTGTGFAFVQYFLNGGGRPAPIIGDATIKGPATFFRAGVPFPTDGVEFDLKITGGGTFELKETLFGGLTVAFSDPTKGISVVDRALLNSFTISNVPLPASAPLFGVALISLGVFASAMKYKAPRSTAPISDQ